LHGVAIRTARKARHLADRRRSREKQVADVPHPAIEFPMPDADLGRVIDEELRRLPELLRLPVLLCDVEGRSRRAVAEQLGIPVGTLGHRLDAARERLARRLTRRGITLAVGATATVAVPRSLAAVTARAVVGFAEGRGLASLVPPQIVALTEGVLCMTPSKFRFAAALTLLVAIGGFGLHAWQRPSATAQEPPKSKAVEPPVDDRTFLRRLSLDLRGTPPTVVETNYFVADKDATKRRKVAEWMLEKSVTWKKMNDDLLLRQTYSKEWLGQLIYDDSHARQANIAEFYFQLAERQLPAKQLADQEQTLSDEKQNTDVAADPKRVQQHVDRALEYLGRFQQDEENARQGIYNLQFHFAEQPAVDAYLRANFDGNDAEFLRRVYLDLTGTVPSPVELRYFTADQDAKKREKLIYWLMQDSANLAKLKQWKTTLAQRTKTKNLGGRYDQLLTELLAAPRSDGQVGEALTLATLARLPTESERRFLAAHMKGRQDRRAAWADVLGALLTTKEHRTHVESLMK